MYFEPPDIHATPPPSTLVKLGVSARLAQAGATCGHEKPELKTDLPFEPTTLQNEALHGLRYEFVVVRRT